MRVSLLCCRKPIWHCLQASSCLLFALVITGCVSPRLYPSEWPELVASSDGPCLSIAGAYRAASDPWPGSGKNCSSSSPISFSDKNPSCVSLPYVLGTSSFPHADSAVTIEQSDGRIAFSFPKRRYPYELKQDEDYRCSGKRIELIPRNTNQSWNVGGGIDDKRWALYRGEDGSLLGKFTEKAVGVIFIPPVPVALYGNRWVRWQPVSTEQSGEAKRAMESTK